MSLEVPSHSTVVGFCGEGGREQALLSPLTVYKRQVENLAPAAQGAAPAGPCQPTQPVRAGGTAEVSALAISHEDLSRAFPPHPSWGAVGSRSWKDRERAKGQAGRGTGLGGVARVAGCSCLARLPKLTFARSPKGFEPKPDGLGINNKITIILTWKLETFHEVPVAW